MEEFDPYLFIDGIIEEMGMQNEDPDRLTLLKVSMMEALGRQIFHAAADNIEEEVIDVVMEKMKDEKDLQFILEELVRTSPGAQMAMAEALDEFKKQTLEAFNALKA